MKLTNFDGVSYGGSGDPYALYLDRNGRTGFDLDTAIRSRPNQPGVRDSFGIAPRAIPFYVTHNPEYSGALPTDAQARIDLFNRFAPGLGERSLTGRLDEFDLASDTVFVRVDVTALNLYPSANDNILEGVFQAVDPIWRGTAVTTGSTSGGAYFTLPTITVVGTNACTRTRYRATDPTDRGLAGHPVKLPIELGDRDWVICRGRVLPHLAQGWVRLDIPAGGTLDFDVWIDTGIVNEVADTLVLDGLNADDSDNTSWVCDDWSVYGHPNADGSFTAHKQGQTFDDISFGVSALSAGSITINVLGETDKYDRVYDCVAVPAGVGITSIDFTATLTATSDARAFVKKLMPGSLDWEPVYELESSGALTTPQSLDGAIAVMIGLEATQALEVVDRTDPSNFIFLGYPQADGGLEISGAATLTLADEVTVTEIETVDGWAHGGQVIENSTAGDLIRFVRVFLPVDGIRIDTLNKLVEPVTADAVGVYDIRFSNPVEWFRLLPGANTVTHDLLDFTLASYDRWVMV